MNKRVLVILLSAFLVDTACSYLVYRVVGKRLMATQNTTRVIVAATDIKLGSVLRDVDLGTTEMAGTVPKGVMVNRQDVVGRGVISNLYQGEPIMESRLAAPGSGGGLAATISQGMRACAVKVDDVVGVAGFVTAGMRVDVLISGNPPGAVNPSEGPKVKTLLQNIQVLSAGTDIQKDGEGKPKQVQVVNLLVTPEQAEEKFGFLLQAFRYGVPPHGGIAFGIDRTVMLLAGKDNIREVIAFPKTQSGTDLLTGAPGEVSDVQLRELGLQRRQQKKP